MIQNKLVQQNIDSKWFKNYLRERTHSVKIDSVKIDSHISNCIPMCGKCCDKLQYEVQKCFNFAAEVSSNWKHLKPYLTRLLQLEID